MRRVSAAIAVLSVALLAACEPGSTVTASAPPPTVETTSTTQLTPEQVAYLSGLAGADAAGRSFLDAVAAARAAVPAQLHRIMWCEAGSYVGLPRYETNYSAMTHGRDGASGGAQIVGSTWLAWAREVGVDVDRWPRAYVAPDWIQDVVATHGYRTRGTAPWRASASCWS